MSVSGQQYELRRGEAGYPSRLEELAAPPEVLYVRGNPDVLNEQHLSIIGARLATPYGLAAAKMAGRVAVECGLCVVSGGARGCDSAAGRAALDAGGQTIVVAGTGADVTYPASSRDVFERAVGTGGAIVSLRPWGSPPNRIAFPQRNFVIAALCESLFVCEAGLHSGTSSTAEAALRLGRRLYSVPGSIFSQSFAGTNRLIRDGAQVICSEQDLEMAISMDYGRLRMSEEGGPIKPEDRIMSALVAEPYRADELAHLLEMSPMDTLMTLTEYEAAGKVSRLRDGRYAPSTEYLLGIRL